MADRRTLRQVFGLTWPPPGVEPRAPDPVLLDNGDVLVPTRGEDGEAKMIRVAVGDDDHAYWLGEVQRQSRTASDGLVIAGFVLALLIPLIGLVVGLVVAAKERVGEGLLIVLVALATGVGGYLLLTQ